MPVIFWLWILCIPKSPVLICNPVVWISVKFMITNWVVSMKSIWLPQELNSTDIVRKVVAWLIRWLIPEITCSDLAVSENYIFALYSGRTLKDYNLDVDKGKTIVVFDWNGLHVRTYQLQNACSAISYDAADNTIYALSQEGNKPQIITLNL